jgi:hypothetical protein
MKLHSLSKLNSLACYDCYAVVSFDTSWSDVINQVCGSTFPACLISSVSSVWHWLQTCG